MIWKIIAGASVIVGIVLGVVEYDDRLAKCDDVKESLTHLEIQVVQTLEQFQKNMNIQQYEYLDDSINRDYTNCRRELRNNPDDPLLQQDCEEIKNERDVIKEKKRSLIN